jgi:hypothetical protein
VIGYFDMETEYLAQVWQHWLKAAAEEGSSGSSVAKGPKFRPQKTKGAEKNCVGPGKSVAEFLAESWKKGRKGVELF